MSYTTAWKYLHELVRQSDYQQLVRSGQWQWVFDNVNLHQTIIHEREGYYVHDHCSTVLSNVITSPYRPPFKHAQLTSRLAIKLRHLPEWK